MKSIWAILRHCKKKPEESTLSNKNHTRKNCSKKQKTKNGTGKTGYTHAKQ